LLSNTFKQKLILTTRVASNADAIKELPELKSLKVFDNKFQLPKILSYKEYIDSGYEDFMKKQKDAKKQEKLKKLQEKNKAIFAQSASSVKRAEGELPKEEEEDPK